MDPQNILNQLGPVPFDVTFVQSLRWSPGRHVASHVHDREYQLDLFSGNGELTLDNRSFPLAGWTVVFIPPGVNHSFTASRVGKFRNLSIKFQAAGTAFPDLPALRFHPRTDADRKNYETGLQTVIEEWQMRRWGWGQAISTRIAALILQVLRVYQEGQDASFSRDTLQEACRYLTLNYSEPVTVAEVARHCRIHPASLSRLFHRHLKTTPRNYLLRLRLNQARLLLAAGHRVTDTAHQTGFSTVHYFSRVFKKIHGLPPGVFRIGSE